MRRLALLQSPEEIAKDLGVSCQTISNVRNRKEPKILMKQIQDSLFILMMECLIPIRDENGKPQLPGLREYLERRQVKVEDEIDRVLSGTLLSYLVCPRKAKLASQNTLFKT